MRRALSFQFGCLMNALLTDWLTCSCLSAARGVQVEIPYVGSISIIKIWYWNNYASWRHARCCLIPCVSNISYHRPAPKWPTCLNILVWNLQAQSSRSNEKGASRRFLALFSDRKMSWREKSNERPLSMKEFNGFYRFGENPERRRAVGHVLECTVFIHSCQPQQLNITLL